MDVQEMQSKKKKYGFMVGRCEEKVFVVEWKSFFFGD